MPCESNPNHKSENYCSECSTCHECLEESTNNYEAEISLLKHDNAKLKARIAELEGVLQKNNAAVDKFNKIQDSITKANNRGGDRMFQKKD